MPAPSTLPSIIGPTENALRALLTATLASTPIRTYPAWVVINAAPGQETDHPNRDWRSHIADALKVTPDSVDHTLTELREAGLVDSRGSLTRLGESARASARVAVGTATSRLLGDVSAADEATARRVLEQIRARAEQLLAQ
ncbi:MAG: hypothetical protein GX610_03475 [Rhodococcus sp.]|nr:hypothetical protein [Rhodococcus sp. (in: high G+C Gram-positive bacteria)]